VIHVRHLCERRSEHRPSPAPLDEVGELAAQPTLEYRDRLALQ
jgi:hypothetical protein